MVWLVRRSHGNLDGRLCHVPVIPSREWMHVERHRLWFNHFGVGVHITPGRYREKRRHSDDALRQAFPFYLNYSS